MEINRNIAVGIKIRRTILFTLFICVLALPILDYGLKLSGEYENTENRNKAPLPKFNIDLLDPFPSQFDSYFSDNHNFRGELLSLNSKFKYNILKISPNKSIVEGKNGWLYLAKYLDSYVSKRLLTNIELDSLKSIFEYRSGWLKKKGIKHYLAIVPNKPQIYPEFLPSFINKKNSTTKTEQLIQALDGIPNLNVIYLKDTLLSAKENAPFNLYYKTDQHWNEYGALVGFSKIISEIKKDFPAVAEIYLDNYNFDTTYTNGKDLAKILMLHKSIKELEIRTIPKNGFSYHKIDTVKYEIPVVFPYKKVHQLYYSNSNKQLPNGLVIRDSFTNALANTLPESFGETTVVWDTWCYELHEDIVENEKPDFLLTIIIETNIPFIIYKHNSIREDGFNAIDPKNEW